MIERHLATHLLELARHFPVVTLTGPRQSGKTTLVRALFDHLPYVSLERVDERNFALEDPLGFLARFPDGAVLDEIQRAPDLPSYLQGLVDEDDRPGRWVLTGSENFTITARTAQSLAGRSALAHLLPLGWGELQGEEHGPRTLSEALWMGGYPALHGPRRPPLQWLSAYVVNYLERDVRQLLNVGDLSTFQVFVELAAGRVGNLLNLNSLARDAGVTQPTAKSWLSVLDASFLTFRLSPWHRNLGKRLVKTPKLYFWDTALVCYLLGIREPAHLERHPLRGAIFENWVVAEVLKAAHHAGKVPRAWFYRDHGGREVDLIFDGGAELWAIEAKSGATAPPRAFSTLQTFASLLATAEPQRGLRLTVAYGGETSQRRSPGQLLSWRDVPLVEGPQPPT